MLRKHINCLAKEELYTIPFYSWNCITLKLKRRDVDLVIRDEKQMEIFLKFLIYSLRTVDGVKNSADVILDYLNKESIKKFKKETRLLKMTQFQLVNISSANEKLVFTQIYKKYCIMKLRAKISFMAFEKGITIIELFLHAIYKTLLSYY